MNFIKRVGIMASRIPVGQSSRKLYTDSIYPYPFKYVNKKWPSQFCYRETYPNTPWSATESRVGDALFVLFWTYFWCQAFAHPEALTGHWNMPDPADFTDQELGIPPDDAGSYKDWLAQREIQ